MAGRLCRKQELPNKLREGKLPAQLIQNCDARQEVDYVEVIMCIFLVCKMIRKISEKTYQRRECGALKQDARGRGRGGGTAGLIKAYHTVESTSPSCGSRINTPERMQERGGPGHEGWGLGGARGPRWIPATFQQPFGDSKQSEWATRVRTTTSAKSRKMENNLYLCDKKEIPGRRVRGWGGGVQLPAPGSTQTSCTTPDA